MADELDTWTDQDTKTLFSSLKLPLSHLCDKYPHHSMGTLRTILEGIHKFHTGGSTDALPESVLKRLTGSTKPIRCPICVENFRGRKRPMSEALAEVDALGPDDFDPTREYATRDRLQALCDEILSSPEPSDAAPAMFRLMERAPDAHFGMPGPLVHALETLGGYENELAASLLRRPTIHTVEMAQRILNGSLSEDERAVWIDRLRQVLARPETDENARAVAHEVLTRQ